MCTSCCGTRGIKRVAASCNRKVIDFGVFYSLCNNSIFFIFEHTNSSFLHAPPLPLPLCRHIWRITCRIRIDWRRSGKLCVVIRPSRPLVLQLRIKTMPRRTDPTACSHVSGLNLTTRLCCMPHTRVLHITQTKPAPLRPHTRSV